MQVLDTLNDIEHCLEALKHKVQLIRADMTGSLYSVDVLMTRKEAADFIGRTVKSVDRLCRERKIRKVFVNGQPRIRKASCSYSKGSISWKRNQMEPCLNLIKSSADSNELPHRNKAVL